ncbi:hypothetical protein OLS44_02220, partial [Campylobacter jejuni]|nr:hypothetical protein [Campylobacter jejuni]
GVTLINLKKWREDNIQELLFQNSAQYAEILQFPDQDTLNITLYKKKISFTYLQRYACSNLL